MRGRQEFALHSQRAFLEDIDIDMGTQSAVHHLKTRKFQFLSGFCRFLSLFAPLPPTSSFEFPRQYVPDLLVYSVREIKEGEIECNNPPCFLLPLSPTHPHREFHKGTRDRIPRVSTLSLLFPPTHPPTHHSLPTPPQEFHVPRVDGL